MKKKFKIFIFTIFICFILNIGYIYGMNIVCTNDAVPGQRITFTINFDTYIGAYDSIDISYNERVMELVTTVDYGPWWDKTDDSKGINRLTLYFNALDNGTSNVSVNVIGAVSADNNMNELGDLYATKKITIGTGINRGDLDGDGVVNANDAAIVLDIFKKENATKQQINTCDMDGNGVLNANDAALILDCFKNYGL